MVEEEKKKKEKRIPSILTTCFRRSPIQGLAGEFPSMCVHCFAGWSSVNSFAISPTDVVVVVIVVVVTAAPSPDLRLE